MKLKFKTKSSEIDKNEYASLLTLDEATFKREETLKDHYDRHVLKPNEQFDASNPKFPPMSLKEYEDAAEALSLEKAQIITNEHELKNARGIIGWVATLPGWRNPRYIKIQTSSSRSPGFVEVVAYVDGDSSTGTQVMTYMLGKMGKKYKLFKDKIGELPAEEIANNERSNANNYSVV